MNSRTINVFIFSILKRYMNDHGLDQQTLGDWDVHDMVGPAKNG
jgi:hypothetical protein